MAGFRLRCECGAWIQVPGEARPVVPPAPPPVPARVRVARDAQGRVLLPVTLGETWDRPIPTSLPMAPGTLLSGNTASRASWTNRAVAELVLMVAALVGPFVAVMLLSRGTEEVLLLPFASLASATLVAVIAVAAGPYGTAGLRAASGRHFAEAALAALAAFAVALLWVELLASLLPDWLGDPFCRELLERLGPAWAAFVVAVSPAFVEELAFRGVLQGRLMALLGARNGLLVTAAAFAICHGPTGALPLHFGLGLYFGWLRERSGSLLPGMLMHCAYNALILFATP